MKRKRMILCLLSALLCGTVFSATTLRSQAEECKIVDDFVGYNYLEVDSARYTLYGGGKFASNEGIMKIDYGQSENEKNGIFVNLSDMFVSGDTVRISFQYGNGNWSTEVAAKASFYYDETPGKILGQTPAVAGKNNLAEEGIISNLEVKIPEFQSSLYLYIQSKAKVIHLDNLSIEKYIPGPYEAVGAAMERLDEAAYTAVSKGKLFFDTCDSYSDVSTIPDRYWVNPESVENSGYAVDTTNGFAGENVFLYPKYTNNTNQGHGLCVNILDLIGTNEQLQAGDVFYLSYEYVQS